MNKSTKVLNEKIKNRFLKRITEFLENEEEEILRVKSNELALPVLDEDGNEKWMVITFKVPTGSRDGDSYDGYAMKQEYEINLAEKEEKARARAEKAAKDKAKREAKAKEKKEE